MRKLLIAASIVTSMAPVVLGGSPALAQEEGAFVDLTDAAHTRGPNNNDAFYFPRDPKAPACKEQPTERNDDEDKAAMAKGARTKICVHLSNSPGGGGKDTNGWVREYSVVIMKCTDTNDKPQYLRKVTGFRTTAVPCDEKDYETTVNTGKDFQEAWQPWPAPAPPKPPQQQSRATLEEMQPPSGYASLPVAVDGGWPTGADWIRMAPGGGWIVHYPEERTDRKADVKNKGDGAGTDSPVAQPPRTASAGPQRPEAADEAKDRKQALQQAVQERRTQTSRDKPSTAAPAQSASAARSQDSRATREASVERQRETGTLRASEPSSNLGRPGIGGSRMHGFGGGFGGMGGLFNP